MAAAVFTVEGVPTAVVAAGDRLARRELMNMEKEHMHTGIHAITREAQPSRAVAWTCTLAIVVLQVLGNAQSTVAEQAAQRTFSSAGAASEALVQAVQHNDEKAVRMILDADAQVTSAGDQGVDRLEREQFVRKYQEMHRLVNEPDGTTVLYVGAENWPFPIPLVAKDGRWQFDADRGSQEILFRRIGENELLAIQVCQVVVNGRMQHETTAASDDEVIQYANRVLKGGSAQGDGTAGTTPENEPFYGYYFRIVAGRPERTAVGTSGAVPGAKQTSVAVVAYPVAYRASGVMTFVLTRNNRVYEKDLGPNTARLAQGLSAFRAASGWHAVK